MKIVPPMYWHGISMAAQTSTRGRIVWPARTVDVSSVSKTYMHEVMRPKLVIISMNAGLPGQRAGVGLCTYYELGNTKLKHIILI